MNQATKLYLLGVTAFAADLGVHALSSNAIPLSREVLLGSLCLITFGVLSEAAAIQFKVGAGSAVSSIGFIPILTAILVFPSPVELLVCCGMGATAEIAVHRRQRLKAAFNISQAVIATAIAAFVYRALYEAYGGSMLGKVASFAALAGTFFFVNQLLISIALSLLQGERFASTFASVISSSGTNVFYDCLASPIAVVVAQVYDEWQALGVLVVSFPLLLIRHAYLSIQKLQQANTDILRVLVKTIETRDPYTSGHSVRVSQLAKAIAEDLKLPPKQVVEIETAALLHDIGKIDTVYAGIILKQSGLTETERGVIVTHAAKGADFLRTLSSFKEHIITSVRHHHERWDGTGYPDRLSGEKIPLAARIIMLCDSIDAMLSDRPYRRALTIEQVRSELLRCSGSQFDPRIVHVILQRNTLERAAKLAAPIRSMPTPLSVAG